MNKENENTRNPLKDLFKEAGPAKASPDFTQKVMEHIDIESAEEYQPILGKKGWIFSLVTLVVISALGVFTDNNGNIPQMQQSVDFLSRGLDNLVTALTSETLRYFLLGLVGVGLYSLLDRAGKFSL